MYNYPFKQTVPIHDVKKPTNDWLNHNFFEGNFETALKCDYMPVHIADKNYLVHTDGHQSNN